METKLKVYESDAMTSVQLHQRRYGEICNATSERLINLVKRYARPRKVALEKGVIYCYRLPPFKRARYISSRSYVGRNHWSVGKLSI